MAGHGSRAQAHEYQLVDPAIAHYATSIVYYRLRQVDLDGTFSYSPVRTVAVPALAGLALFPNPTYGTTTLTGTQPRAIVVVLDAVGCLVASFTADTQGIGILALPTSLTSGVYTVRTGNSAMRLTVTH